MSHNFVSTKMCACNSLNRMSFVLQAMRNDDHLQLQTILIENRDLVHFQSDVTDEGVYLVHKAAQLDRPICFDILVQQGASKFRCVFKYTQQQK